MSTTPNTPDAATTATPPSAPTPTEAAVSSTMVPPDAGPASPNVTPDGPNAAAAPPAVDPAAPSEATFHVAPAPPGTGADAGNAHPAPVVVPVEPDSTPGSVATPAGESPTTVAVPDAAAGGVVTAPPGALSGNEPPVTAPTTPKLTETTVPEGGSPTINPADVTANKPDQGETKPDSKVATLDKPADEATAVAAGAPAPADKPADETPAPEQSPAPEVVDKANAPVVPEGEPGVAGFRAETEHDIVVEIQERTWVR